MHSTTQTLIETQESVYRDSPIGKLKEDVTLIGSMPISHQQGFDSDSKTCFPVAIDDLSAFAFEQGIIGTMSIPNSTAVGTPFACMPTVHDVQQNIIIKASLFKDLFELIKRNTHNSSIESSANRLEPFEFFNTDIGIKSDGKIDNFPNDLSEISSDKVPFIALNPFEFLFSINRLEFCTSFHNLLSLNPDVLSKIGLIQNLSIRRNNTNSEMFGIDIDTKNILSLSNLFFFGEISNNLKIRSQTEGLASPSILNQILKSLIVSVLLNRNCDSVSGVNAKFHKESAFCAECFAIPRHVKFDGNGSDFFAFAPDYITFNIADNLTIEGSSFFAN